MSPVKFSVCGGEREGMLMQAFLEPYNASRPPESRVEVINIPWGEYKDTLTQLALHDRGVTSAVGAGAHSRASLCGWFQPGNLEKHAQLSRCRAAHSLSYGSRSPGQLSGADRPPARPTGSARSAAFFHGYDLKRFCAHGRYSQALPHHKDGRFAPDPVLHFHRPPLGAYRKRAGT